MAISAPGEGFFTSDGVLRTDQSSPRQSKPKTAETAASESDQAAAVEISDAAVVSITSGMNVGQTGFDSGVSDLVQKAVSSALTNLGAASSAVKDTGIASPSFTRTPVFGTYQNSIMYPESPPQQKPAAPPETGPEPPENPIPREDERDEEAGGGKRARRRRGSYDDEPIAAPEKSRPGRKKRDVEA